MDSLRDLLDELHEARIAVERLSIHTPDLDDVFFAVTGSYAPTSRRRPRTTRSSDTMTTLAYTLTDSGTMLRRNLKHQLRYPSMTVMLIGMPIVFLLLFVYVFGGQARRWARRRHGGRGAYLDYVVPGILLMTVASAVQGTSISIAMDMTSGIIDRFRTMAIARASVLTGHVLGSLIQTLALPGPRDRCRPRPRFPPDCRPARVAGGPRLSSGCSPSR